MSVIKRTAPSGTVTWLARVFREFDSDAGRQKVVAKSFRTQKEAKAWEASITKSVGEGTYQEPTKTTLSEFFYQWLNDSAKIKLKVQTGMVSVFRTLELDSSNGGSKSCPNVHDTLRSSKIRP